MPNLLAAPTHTTQQGLSILDRMLDRLNDARMLDRAMSTDFYCWLGTVSATGTLCRLSVWLAVHPRSEPDPAYILDGIIRAAALPQSNSQTETLDPWEQRVRELEAEGLTRSDAQGVADAEIDMREQRAERNA